MATADEFTIGFIVAGSTIILASFWYFRQKPRWPYLSPLRLTGCLILCAGSFVSQCYIVTTGLEPINTYLTSRDPHLIANCTAILIGLLCIIFVTKIDSTLQQSRATFLLVWLTYIGAGLVLFQAIVHLAVYVMASLLFPARPWGIN